MTVKLTDELNEMFIWMCAGVSDRLRREINADNDKAELKDSIKRNKAKLKPVILSSIKSAMKGTGSRR